MYMYLQRYNGWHSKAASGPVKSTGGTGRDKNRTGGSSHIAQTAAFAAK